MADYPLTINRGNIFDIGFQFEDENEDVVQDLSVVRFTFGIGDTVFLTKRLYPDDDAVYYLHLTEDETRLVGYNFRYEVETDELTVLSGLLVTQYGDNLDAD